MIYALSAWSSFCTRIQRYTFELFGAREPLLGLRVYLLSPWSRSECPPLLLLVALRDGLLLRSLLPLRPFRPSPRANGVRFVVSDLEAERGEIDRRGADRVLEGVCDLA